MAFVFYDTETTGTDTTFDQILQFAAILTDGDFRELDRFEIRCRLMPHVEKPVIRRQNNCLVKLDLPATARLEIIRTRRKNLDPAAFGTSLRSRQCKSLVAIGGIADIVRHWRTLLTPASYTNGAKD
jgi:hypothetical protein